ncbi:MAG: serine/threonine-protein kinase [Nannocystaceae bacterium]|nr:serine/threonine-protein kinase [Nannocystaceae bacterium]
MDESEDAIDLDSARTQTLGISSTGAVALSIALEPGTRIGRYLVRMRLGAGGMGEVYEAYDPELDRVLAIKLVHPRADRHTEEQRLLVAEAQALAQLSHPNVVQVYDAGTHGGRVFVAMELVEGRTLQTWLRAHGPDAGRRASWQQLVDLFLDAGRGLAAAHAAGIVHGDVKPSNVMVGSDGRARVFDFGLARTKAQTSGSIDEVRDLGRSNSEVRGTPGFMAPEQFRGGELLPATDQFAFCVSLYVALFGQPPFAGESLAELRRNVTAGAVRVPRGHDVPPALRRAVLRGLRVDPATRHESMDALLATLARLRHGRWRWLIAAAAVAGGVAVTAASLRGTAEDRCGNGQARADAVWNDERRGDIEGALSLLGKRYADDGARAVTTAFDAWVPRWVGTYREVCEAALANPDPKVDRAMGCLTDALLQLDATAALLARADAALARKAAVMAQGLPEPARCPELAAKDVGRGALDDQDPEVMRMRAAIAAGRARTQAARFDDAISMLSAVVEQAQAQQQPWVAVEAKVLLAEAYDLGSRRDDAMRLYRETIAEAAACGHGRAEGQAWTQLVRVAANASDFEESDRARKQAEIWLERLDDRLNMGVDLGLNVGIAQMGKGDYVGACETFERTLDALVAAGRGDDSRVAALSNNLGAAWGMRGDHRRAREYFERSAELKRAVVGPDHPDVATAMNNVGVALSAIGEDEQARDRLREVLALRRRALDPDHPEIAASCHNLGAAEAALGNHDVAVALYLEGLAIRERRLGADHPSTAVTRNNLADAYVEMGRTDDALAQAEQSLAHLQRRLGEQHPHTAFPLHTMGECHRLRGDYESAIGLLRRAETVRTGTTADPFELGRTRLALALALRDGGHLRDEVRRMAEAAIVDFGTTPRGLREAAKARALLDGLPADDGDQ